MKVPFYTLLLILSMCFLMNSCSSEEKSDGAPPQIFDIRFNIDTQVIYLKDSVNLKYDTIIVNPKKYKLASDLDTLILDNPVTINGKLKSENGLTNMKVKIYGDTLNVSDSTVTCVNITEVPLTYFFGKDSTNLEKVTVTTSLSSTRQVEGLVTPKPVREGDEYQYTIYVIDREGKVNSTSYHQKPIVILSLDSIVKLEKEKLKP